LEAWQYSADHLRDTLSIKPGQLSCSSGNLYWMAVIEHLAVGAVLYTDWNNYVGNPNRVQVSIVVIT